MSLFAACRPRLRRCSGRLAFETVAARIEPLEPRLLLSGLSPGQTFVQQTGLSPTQAFPDLLSISSFVEQSGDGRFFAGDFGGFDVSVKCTRNDKLVVKSVAPDVKARIKGTLNPNPSGSPLWVYGGRITGGGLRVVVNGEMF